MSTPATIRMFNEYTLDWPFFGPEGALGQDEFPLPPDLSCRVLAWAADFNEHYSWETGWPSVEHRSAAHQEGQELAREVQEAVGPDVEIRFEFWETAVDDDNPSH